MTLEDMKRRRDEFRHFYRVIVDKILKESPKIMEFIRKNVKGKGNKTRRLRKRSV